jgi:hypothetical protein
MLAFNTHIAILFPFLFPLSYFRFQNVARLDSPIVSNGCPGVLGKCGFWLCIQGSDSQRLPSLGLLAASVTDSHHLLTV